MRILEVAPFYPPHVGGIEFHVEALSRRLAAAGHQVTVVTSNVPRLKRCEVVEGVEVYRLCAPLSPLNNPIVPGIVSKVLARRDLEIIHLHGHFHATSTLALLSNLVAKKPVVLTSHGAILEFKGWRAGIEALFNSTVGKWTLRSVDKVIALSDSQAAILEKLGAPREKIAVIPLWVEVGRIDGQGDGQRFRGVYGFGDRMIVLFVGRLLPVKGLEYLIEAAKHVKLNAAVVVIGDEAPGYSGTKDALYRQVRKLGLEHSVFFLGRFSKEELKEAYLAADVFVLPSLGEGMPLTLLEAMSYGKCVVATNVPGSRDVVESGRNGLLVEPRNSGRLAQAIDEVLSDNHLRERLGSQARLDIERSYHPDVVVGKILESYQDCLRKS